MSAESDRILKMVEDGAISAAEAADLLAAIETEESPATSGERLPATRRGDAPWEAPFVAGIVLSGFGLLGLIRSRNDGVLSRVGAWLTLLLGLGAAIAGFWSRNTPWLHITVQERDGHSMHVSLPLLLPLVHRVLNLARDYVDAGTAVQLDSAAAFIDGLQRGEQPDPVRVAIEDGEGGEVLIYVA